LRGKEAAMFKQNGPFSLRKRDHGALPLSCREERGSRSRRINQVTGSNIILAQMF
jgi:hypothetical protein